LRTSCIHLTSLWRFNVWLDSSIDTITPFCRLEKTQKAQNFFGSLSLGTDLLTRNFSSRLHFTEKKNKINSFFQVKGEQNKIFPMFLANSKANLKEKWTFKAD
jgi:hypothetical protein